MKKQTFKYLLMLLMMITATQAFADVPVFMETFSDVVIEFAVEIIIGLIIIIMWMFAGYMIFARSSYLPAKFAAVATIILVAAPFIAGDQLTTWAQTTFGS